MVVELPLILLLAAGLGAHSLLRNATTPYGLVRLESLGNADDSSP
jgi:hypothetical protein